MAVRRRADGGYLPRLLILTVMLGTITSSRADVTGTITLKGQPNSKDETFYAKASNCGESPIRHTENWKIGPRGELADVVVWIVDPKFVPVTVKPLPPPAEIEVKQLGCTYVPHVAAVQAGVPFRIINGDPTLHNIRARAYDGPGKPPGANIFNFGQSYQGQTDERQFDQPGIYTLECNVHSWMQCWVMVLPPAILPAYAVTTTDGSFKIIAGETLADGDYKIDAWHPRFALPIEQTVHIKNGMATANFIFDGAKSF
jgi:plastocyanin